ncbi:HAAS signaling domain-containing protein [Actinoallomurus sp. CA-142502]|uniref:HAAS signaling domain-containing protein n=1 Tax=Actinoallomurus sp. CA-142502 TaxID=3239885 RepID=UPI003D8DD9AD
MTATDELIEDYLGRLETAARTLPSAQRAELLAEIKAHIEITLSQEGHQDEATVRTVLDRLGTPEDIVREAGAEAEPSPRAAATGRRAVGAFELVAVILLLIGGIVLPGLGWVIGVVLLWASARWTTLDKLIGTLIFPGGLAVGVWFLFFWSGSSVCSADGACKTSGAGLASTICLVATVGSIGSAAYLLRRAKHPAM